MKTRCNDCAFTIGTQASKAPHTAVVARLCAMTAEPFDCHVSPGACVGWAEEVAERKRTGALLEPGSSAFQTAQMCGEMLTTLVDLAAREQGGK